MEYVIGLVQETGMVIGIMVCVTGMTIGMIQLVNWFWMEHGFLEGFKKKRNRDR